jgi:hypothetical protein
MNKGLKRHVTRQSAVLLIALFLAILPVVAPLVADATLHTGFVAAALADGPVRGNGG